jgi:hypothetical protein
VVTVLSAEAKPRTCAEIHQMIVARELFTFKARDPVAMVRSAIRKHLRAHGGAGQPPARIRHVDRDRYLVP